MHGLLGLLPTSGENCNVNSTFRNIFTGRNGDMFDTYFTRCNVSYRIFSSRILKNIIYWMHIQWGKKVFSQPPIVQVLPLKKIREACNFHHRYTSTMRDKIRKKISRKSHCRIFKEFICKLWWKISIWSITKFHLNTLLYTLCWQWQRSNVFCKSSQGFHTLLLVFWPIPPCRSPLEQWCFGAVAGQHELSTPSKDFLWGWDLETG